MRYHDRILRALHRERNILHRQVQEACAAGRDTRELERDLRGLDTHIDIVDVVRRVFDDDQPEPWSRGLSNG